VAVLIFRVLGKAPCTSLVEDLSGGTASMVTIHVNRKINHQVSILYISNFPQASSSVFLLLFLLFYKY
jgi:hypothetical protein